MANNEGRVNTVSGYWSPRKCGSERVPLIRLCGSWLNAFGFAEGDKFQVIYSFEEGTLVLQKVSKI